MKLVPIFVDDDTQEGLHSVRFKGIKTDEFDRNIDMWHDPEYVRNFVKGNKLYFDKDFFKTRTTESIINQIHKEATDIEKLIREYVNEGFEKNGKKLQMLFRPLYKKDQSSLSTELMATKASVIKAKRQNDPILRLYAIKIADNTFIITGGAIKITKRMADHPDTNNELQKIDTVKNWLKSKGIKFEDDLIYYYDEYQ